MPLLTDEETELSEAPAQRLLSDEETELSNSKAPRLLSDEETDGLSDQAPSITTVPQWLPSEFQEINPSSLTSKELAVESIRGVPGQLSKPLVKISDKVGLSAENLANAVDVMGAYAGGASMGTSAMSPSSKVPTPSSFIQETLQAPDRKPTVLEKTLAGSQQAIVESLDFFTSPLGVATLGAGSFSPAVQKGVTAYFLYDMAKNVPEQLSELHQAVKSGDPERISKAATGVGLTGAFITAGAKHGLKGTPELIGRTLDQSISRLLNQADNLGLTRTSSEAYKQAIKKTTEGGETTNAKEKKEGVQVAPTDEPPVITPPEVPAAPAGGAPLMEVIGKSTMAGRDTYRVKSPGVGGETTVTVKSGTPIAEVESAWTKQRGESEKPPTQPEPAPPEAPASEVPKTQSRLDTLLESQKGGGTQVDSANIAAEIRAEGEAGIAKVKASLEKSRADAKALIEKAKTTAEKIAVMESPEHAALTQRNQVLDEALKYEKGLSLPNMPEAKAIIDGLKARQAEAQPAPVGPSEVTQRGQMEVRLPAGERPSVIQNKPWTPIEVKLFNRLRAKADAKGEITNQSIEDLKNLHGGRVPTEVSELQQKGGEIPNATQTETPVAGASQTPTGTPAPVAEGSSGGGSQPVGPRTEAPQAETPTLTPETPSAPPIIPSAPPPPPKPPPKDYSRDPGSPIGIKNAEIDKLRAEMGMDPIEKAVGMPDVESWQRVMDRIDQDPHWIDTIIKDIKETGRGHTADEALALDHRLVEIRTEFDKAAREAAKARDEGRVADEAQSKLSVNLWSDRLAELSQVTTSSGTTMGRAFRARQLMMNEDFSLAALETRKRAAKDWEPLNDSERAEIAKTHAEYVAKTAELEAHLAEQSGKRVDAEIKLAAAEAARGPDYDPRLLKLVEDVASFMDKAADAARARLEARRKASGGMVRMDPTGGVGAIANVPDMAIIGAAKIARKINDFAKWSDAMVKDLGDWIKPHLAEVWEASQIRFQQSVEERLKTLDSATKAKATAKLTGQNVAEKIAAAKAGIEAKVEKGQLSGIFHQVQKLVRAIVERDPQMTREPLIDEVHGILSELIPDITRMESMDAISGRGRFIIPKQDQVSKTVRDLKTQTRLVAHAIDVEAGRPLPRTGFQHGKLSDVARNLEQKLNELKRKFGVETVDPETQLASVLQARKTYYQNRIADLNLEIKTRELIVKSRTPSKTDPELEALIAEHKNVTEEHQAIFKKPGLTIEQRLALSEKSAERQILELKRQLKMDEVFPKSRRPLGITDEKLEALHYQIEALKAEREWARMRIQPKPEVDLVMQALARARARMTRQLADYTQRIADGDYAPRTRKPPTDITQDARAMELMADLQKVKRDFDKGLALDEAKRRTKVQKFFFGAGEVLNLPKSLWSAFDVSAVGRQGGILLLGHPLRAAKSIVPMFKALFSEKAAMIEEQKILNRPNYKNGNYDKSKLYLASLDEFRLSRQEEIMMAHYANLIPGVRASNRAFMTYLNKLRADSFDVMLKSREGFFSKPVEQFEKNAISNYINIVTGRGDLGKHTAAAQTLSTIFWAPRLMASRFQYLAGQPLWRGGARVRAMVAMEYARTLAGMSVVLGLGSLAGADIELDPRSSDFLKMKFGNSRVDIMGGLIQNTVFLTRVFSGKKKSQAGKIEQANLGATTWQFGRNKFTPTLGMSVDARDLLLGQKPPAGHPQTMADLVVNVPFPLSFRDSIQMMAPVPLSFDDLIKVMESENVPKNTALQIASLFGWGVQTYNSQKGDAESDAAPSPFQKALLTPVQRAINPP